MLFTSAISCPLWSSIYECQKVSGVCVHISSEDYSGVSNDYDEPTPVVPNDSLQAVELSQWFQAAVQIVSNLPGPSNGVPIYRFLGMRTRWMAGAAAHKSG